MWKLIIEDDEGKRTTVPLTRDDYTIGRKEGNTIRLTERNVSREHAKIRRANGPASPYSLEDHSSYNGVYVNGLRVAQPQELQHGDLIQIGDYRIVLQDDAADEVPAALPGATTEHMKATLPTGQMNRGSQLMERPNRLVMLAGPTPGVEFPLTDERITIGRAEDATISINHNSVSRLHCEIHALGEGRFEIVDKGSSNGVRVNGSDLRRGIIEAGDVLELGDVRMRFVGAGQIFLPGVGDSQQLEALSDRTPSSLPAATQAQGSGVLPWVIVGAMIALLVVLGGYLYIQKTRETPTPTPTATQSPEEAALAAAKVLCDQGKCDLAHDKLLISVPEGSSLRTSSDYQTIETRWADGVLDRADKETDPTRKRALLHQVSDATTVPDSRKQIALSKLRELDAAQQATTSPSTTNVRPPPTVNTATAPTVTNTAPTSTGTGAPTGTGATTGTATAPSGTGSAKKPPAQSPFDKASDLVLHGDQAGARAILETRVFSLKAPENEVRLLYGICKGQGDKVCTAKIRQSYPALYP